MHRFLQRLTFLLLSLIIGARESGAAAIHKAPDLSNGKPLTQLRLLPDGNGVVGITSGEIFRWRLNEERVTLGAIPPTMDGYIVNPIAISGDGSSIIGDFRFQTDGPGREPDYGWLPAPYRGFRWTANGGLNTLTMGRPDSGIAPIAVSFDGSTFVGVMGYQESPLLPPITSTTRWSNGQFEQLALPNLTPVPNIIAESFFLISGNGNHIVGRKYSGGDDAGVFQWMRDGGVQDWTPVGVSGPRVSALSHDGTVFVGSASFTGFDHRAFRWTAASGMQMLDAFDLFSEALAVTADGSTVLGFSSRFDTSRPGGGEIRTPFLWDEAHGSRRISEILDNAGVAWRHLDWFNPNDVTQLSADGSALFGSTRTLNPNSGQIETTSWIVTLTVPEPSSVALACLGTTTIATTRRRARIH